MKINDRNAATVQAEASTVSIVNQPHSVFVEFSGRKFGFFSGKA